ncbi:hypothetical protein WN55_03028 [Dufourea novaeangliae]|uniref:Uncharacterized protein n=1 Tax=Dufourea novaeangliae TaxID=178035 RepID=A0A154PHX0_DUFNO|nr:hypothetical protein WN55_03028 [Dufourea novaeangliae]
MTKVYNVAKPPPRQKPALRSELEHSVKVTVRGVTTIRNSQTLSQVVKAFGLLGGYIQEYMNKMKHYIHGKGVPIGRLRVATALKSPAFKNINIFITLLYYIFTTGNGSVSRSMCDEQITKFLSTRRSGRRNALTDSLACRAETGIVELPDRFEGLSVNIVKVKIAIKPGGYENWFSKICATGSIYLNAEFTVTEGPYAKCKIYQEIGIKSGKAEEKAIFVRKFGSVAVLNGLECRGKYDEEKLWIAVIEKAMNDALGKNVKLKEEAIKWLNSESFKTAYELVNLDYEHVKNCYMWIIKSCLITRPL